MVLLCCNYTLNICHCCQKVTNILSCAFMTSLSSETEVKSLSRLSPDSSSWSSGLVKGIHLMHKNLLHPNRILHLPPKSLQKVYNELFEQTKASISGRFWSGFLSSEHESISDQPFAKLCELSLH